MNHHIVEIWRLKIDDPSRKLVAILIADMANMDDEAWPSLKYLANYAELSVDSVRRHIRALEEMGIVVRREQFKDGRQTSNRYEIVDFETLKSLPRVEDMQGLRKRKGEGGMDARGEGGMDATPYNPNIKPSLIPQPEASVIDLDIPEDDLTSIQSKSKAELLNEKFETFWKAYPKEGRAAKPAAFRAFKKHAKNLPAILQGIEKHKLSEKWKKAKGQFIPNPATFLNQEQFNDEPRQESAKTNPSANRPSPGNAGTANASNAKRYGARS